MDQQVMLFNHLPTMILGLSKEGRDMVIASEGIEINQGLIAFIVKINGAAESSRNFHKNLLGTLLQYIEKQKVDIGFPWWRTSKQND